MRGDDGMRYALLRLQSILYDKKYGSNLFHLTSLFAHNTLENSWCNLSLSETVNDSDVLKGSIAAP